MNGIIQPVVKNKLSPAKLASKFKSNIERFRFWIMLVPGILLGLVLVSSGIGKLLGENTVLLNIEYLWFFPEAFKVLISQVLPWLELTLGLLFFAGVAVQIVSLLSLVMIAGFIFQNIFMILHGLNYEPCHCFGILERIFGGELSTTNALTIDIVMMVFVMAIFFNYRGRLVNLRPWWLGKTRT